jgi:ornithine lipid ester-linked acyl 2-hydroxylase
MSKASSVAPANMDSTFDVEKPGLALKLFGRLIDLSEHLNRKHSLVGNQPVFGNEVFPWAAELEAHWQDIRRELDGVLPYRASLPNFQDVCADVGNIQTDDQWKTFFLYGYGVASERNCARCPRTVELLKRIPGVQTAFFSILSPGKHIPAHRGPYNGVLRYHLGLLVPEPRERCRIRIDSGFHHWEEGRSLIFDDSYNHEVWNDTSGLRAVLFVDFLRPTGFPANFIQKAIVKMAKWTPFIKASQDRHEKWEQKFYQDGEPIRDDV